MAIGEEKGREEGMEKGAKKKQVEIAVELLTEGMSIDQVAKITKLSVEEIKKISKEQLSWEKVRLADLESAQNQQKGWSFGNKYAKLYVTHLYKKDKKR